MSLLSFLAQKPDVPKLAPAAKRLILQVAESF